MGFCSRGESRYHGDLLNRNSQCNSGREYWTHVRYLVVMGDGFRKITRRLKRLFVADSEPKTPPKLNTSRVIKPEQVIPEQGKPAPKTTTRRIKPPEEAAPPASLVKIEVLAWGVTHVQFIPVPVAVEPPIVSARDPVTRRLDRRELRDGLKTQKIYYDERGRLID